MDNTYGSTQHVEEDALPTQQFVVSVESRTGHTKKVLTALALIGGIFLMVTQLSSAWNSTSNPSQEILDAYTGKMSSLNALMKSRFEERKEQLAALGKKFTSEAEDALITDLPGLDYDPGFLMYSGFLEVSPDKKIFYWAVESKRDAINDDVVFWTNGGPGCSGLLGMLMEMGPFHVQANMALTENEYAWNQQATMVFLEQPAGVGFSYSDNLNDYYTGDKVAARDNVNVILEFQKMYPHLAENNMYITAESYGGHYIPQWASAIVDYNEENGNVIPFKGFMVGNPYTNLMENEYGMVNAWWGHSMVPWSLYHKYEERCGSYISTDMAKFEAGHCYVYENLMWSYLDGVNPYALSYESCHLPSEEASMGPSRSRMLEVIRGKQAFKEEGAAARLGDDEPWGGETWEGEDTEYDACELDYQSNYLNLPLVREALHVDVDKEWKTCSDVLHWRWGDYYDDMVYYYTQLISKDIGLKMMVFSGDDDSVCGTPGTQLWLYQMVQELGLETKSSWHKWFYNGEVAGYIVAFEKQFRFATVHGAGHEVPAYKPGESLKLFNAFLDGDNLDTELGAGGRA
ncbi:unnamed protein product [Heterosigma akashiwo]